MIKITINKGQNVYFTSDTHYNHKNLCKGVTDWDNTRPGKVRDFNTLYEMNSKILSSINSSVGEDDILFHFGDWSFGGVEQIWEFRKQIICKNIYLFFGNHDHHIIDNKILPNCHEVFLEDWKIAIDDNPNPNSFGDDRDRMFDIHTQSLFTWCGYYGEFELRFPQPTKSLPIPKFKFVGMHYPITSWNEMGRSRIHLHGHLHSSPRHKLHQGRSMDVGMDGNHFKPYSLKEIQNIMDKQPINPTNLKIDHHLG